MIVKTNLSLDDSSNEQVVFDGRHYCNSMEASAYFSAPHIISRITTTRTSITNLETEMNAPISEEKTKKINQLRNIVDRNITRLSLMVENIANDPEVEDDEREVIVAASGMRLKEQGHRSKQKFEAKNSEISGTIILTAEGGADAHEWKYSLDTEHYTGEIHLRATKQAHAEINGLTKGIEIAIFHSKIDKDSPHEWEGPIFITVT